MLRFLSSAMLVADPVNYKHFFSSKIDGFKNFCDWYESPSHDATSSFTLFEVQKQIQDCCRGVFDQITY